MVVVLSVGVGRLIIWIGAFVLLGTFLVVKGFTGLERKLASSLLRTTIPSRVAPNPVFGTVQKSVFEKARDLMISRESWAGIGYLLMKFPLGIISFVLTVTLMSVSLAFTVSPFLAVYEPLSMDIGPYKIDTPLEAAPFSILGLVLMFFSLHILNGLAWVHAGWAKLCLKRLPTR